MGVVVVEDLVGVRVGAADVVGWGEVKEEEGEMAGVGVEKVGGVGLPLERRCRLVSPATDVTQNPVRHCRTNEAQHIAQPLSASACTKMQTVTHAYAHYNTDFGPL